MASLPVRVTASVQVTAEPGSLDRILFGSHNGAVMSLWNGAGNGVGTRLLGTFVCPPTVTTGAIELITELKFDTALYATIIPNAGNSVDFLFCINGSPR